MRWDARGRLWVIQSKTYPQLQPGEIPDDKVLILEDTKHGGYADTVDRFGKNVVVAVDDYQSIAARGVCYYKSIVGNLCVILGRDHSARGWLAGHLVADDSCQSATGRNGQLCFW